MSVWVKFHDALRKGAKRAIPKSSRFVFLELCIEARPLLGEIDLRTDMDTGDAVHDLLGGDRDENRKAVTDLLRAGMMRVDTTTDGTRLVIPSWEHWNKADESTERVKRWREKKKRAPVTETQDVTLRNVTPTVTETGRGEERRVEKNRGEETAPVTAQPPPALPLKADAREVREELARADDLWPDAEIDRVAKRIADNVSDPMNRAKGDHVPITREAVAYARTELGKFEHATAGTLLGKVEQKVGWILADYRTLKRHKTGQGPNAASLELDHVPLADELKAARNTIARTDEPPPLTADERKRRAAQLAEMAGKLGRGAA